METGKCKPYQAIFPAILIVQMEEINGIMTWPRGSSKNEGICIQGL